MRKQNHDRAGFTAAGSDETFHQLSLNRAGVTVPIDDIMTKLPVMLHPNPARVVIKPFVPAEDPPEYASKERPRSQRIADRVLAMNETGFQSELARVLASLNDRYRDVETTLARRFQAVNGSIISKCSLTHEQELLIGAYFSEEYAFEAAALFNPSIVIHPNQSGVAAGSLRFVLSLRGVGEGHVSSVTFRTGLWLSNSNVVIDPPSPRAITPRIEYIPGADPDNPRVRLFCEESHDLSEIVIFPITPSQRHGIEDVRLVGFTEDDGTITYYGTFTAFSGETIRQEMLSTTDFATFEIRALRGAATDNKGMALFPRKIDGRYAMLGRQDHETIWLLTSDDLHRWDDGKTIITPRWPWEFVQLGNSGSPIEIDEGWLVLTHGVGAVRNYCLGACLLDRDDPSKLLARTTHPLLRPSPEERFGYVPNIAYSCGAVVHNRNLLLPYALADSFTSFATVPIDTLLAAMA
jgi:predicted GH43/DUF377 family glycosyl hydrolase